MFDVHLTVVSISFLFDNFVNTPYPSLQDPGNESPTLFDFVVRPDPIFGSCLPHGS
jgi:hypothetical protein